MPQTAITAEGLGKKYRISANREQYGTLRDAIANAGKRLLGSRARLEDYWALRDVSFDLGTGDVLGLIGKNGAGKSTLLKILAKITTPTEGWAEIRGRVGSLLEVGSGFNPELSGRENVYLNGAILGMTRREMARKFDDIVSFSGIEQFIDTPVKRYSTGMHMRLAFAVAAHLEPEILLIDEVLAVGDAEFQKRCLGTMENIARAGRTVVFVSHNLTAIKSLCDRCMVLERGQVVFDGSPALAVEEYLTRGAAAHTTGEIPRDWPRQFSTGEAFFSRACVLDEDGIESRELYYRSPIVVRMALDVLRPITDAIVQVSIGTPEGEKVLFAESADTLDLLNLATGSWTLEVQLSTALTPGHYSLFLSLSHRNGEAIDWVERVYDFTVRKLARQAGLDYRWEAKHGHVSVTAPWDISLDAVAPSRAASELQPSETGAVSRSALGHG
jgi:lipopolysaccharide transport system ATP-binding protein